MARDKNINTEIALIKADIIYMKEKVDDLHLKVVGNGSRLGLVDDMNQMKGGISTVKWVYGALISLLGILVAVAIKWH